MQEIKPGKYRHFKGREYQVIATAKHSETEELMVIYKPLYDEGTLWVRPAHMWNDIIERDGKSLRRFEPVEEQTDKE